MTAPVVPSDFSEIRWRGHWIWVETPKTGGMFAELDPVDPVDHQETHGLFRKSFILEQAPRRVPARMTADSRYVLFANGREVYRGPVRSQPRRLNYDLFDLAPYLQAGENTLAVHVKYYGKPNPFWIPARPNSTLGKTGVMVFEADLGQDGWLVSDESWRARKSDAWSEAAQAGHGPAGVPGESFDARRFPLDWQAPGFDDHAWEHAHLIPAVHMGGFAYTSPPTDPYGPLFPRPIGRLGGAVYVPPAAKVEILTPSLALSGGGPNVAIPGSLSAGVTHQDPAAAFPLQFPLADGTAVRVTMDLGRIVAGFPQFEVEAPAGTIFDFMYTEDLLGGPPRFGGLNAGTRYIARGMDDGFQVFDANGLRYIYLLVHGGSGTIRVKSVSVQEDVYPWQPGAEFRCSDDTLNAIFTAGIRTVQLNSRDSFTDCPTREQRAWVGDGVVHQMVHLATNTDWRLAWHYLTLSDSPRSDGILPMSVAGDVEAGGGVTIPDWSLHWIHGVYNLYRFTGDWQRVKAHLPSVERVLRWYLPFMTAGGQLKDLIEWDLVDWASISTRDTSGVITALWARGLKEFAEMAAWLEEKSSQRWAEAVYAKVKAGFEVFWDEGRGSYVDHLVDGVRQPEMSQLGGAFAIVSELAPKERWRRIIETITDPQKLVEATWMGKQFSPEKVQKHLRGIYEPDWDVHHQVVRGQPFISYIVHDAVAKAGMAERLPELCRTWQVFFEGGYDTIGENWGYGTHVHGWSCSPTRDLVFYTLGVTPEEPGYAVARIAPRLGGLAWAEGKVPSPHGLISVRAEPDRVTIDTPVPVVLDLAGRAVQQLAAGRHVVSVG